MLRENSKATFRFSDLFLIRRYVTGVPIVDVKGYHFFLKGYIKGLGAGNREKPSNAQYKTLLSSTPRFNVDSLLTDSSFIKVDTFN